MIADLMSSLEECSRVRQVVNVSQKVVRAEVPGIILKGQIDRLCASLHQQGARSKLAVPSIWLPWNTLSSWAKHLASSTTSPPHVIPITELWDHVRNSPMSHLIISDCWLKECLNLLIPEEMTEEIDEGEKRQTWALQEEETKGWWHCNHKRPFK